MSLSLKTVKGVDIFATPSDTIVIPVNCVGVMGAGLARQFATKYPSVFIEYHKACSEGRYYPGGCFEYILPVIPIKYALLVTTKRHWKEASTISMVESCAIAIRRNLEQRLQENPLEPIDISIPALGCGCGRLSWEQVKSVLIQVFGLWEPKGTVTVRLLDPGDPTRTIPPTLFGSNHYQ